MTARFGLWLLLAAAGWGYAFWVYRRRELPVRARPWMAVLRGASLALVLLLLLDFDLPSSGGVGGAWTVVDVSHSMQVPQGGDGGRTPASSLQEALDAGRVGLLTAFGTPVRRLPEGWRPGADDMGSAADSRLAPALARALESGATEVRILTDLRIQDPVEVEALVRAASAPVRFVDLGGPVRNAGVAELALPATGEAGQEVAGEVILFGEAPGPIRLTLTAGGELLADTTVMLEGSGRVRVPVRFEAPDQAGQLPVTAAVTLDGDVHPGDDTRTRLVELDPGAGELVLVSWMPDWEPRFLLPVLEEVTGLRADGFLRVGADRYMTMTGPVRFVDGSRVARALEESRLGVVHAFPGEPGESWARALARAPRILRIPGGANAGGTGGEWYLSAEVPPSPVAGELAGVPVLGLPPLAGLRQGDGGGSPVLLVQRAGTGDPTPAIVLRETDSGRRAVALAHGFWRWGFREGAPRELYRRLWSGVAGWLLAGDGPDFREVGLAPAAQVARPGEMLEWRAGPAAGGMLAVGFAPFDAPPPVPGDSLPVDSLGRVAIQAPASPGVWRWTAAVLEGPGEGETASGLMVIEEGALDLLPARAVHLTDIAVAAAGSVDDRGGRRPLRTHPVPYLLLLVVLAAEWTARRRSGLR